ncbi:multiple coagulation factor deficiency protein 2 homolog [Vespa mandarinia]|uniref:multiple coagulation factor deficiency protein 2 homolog n=1 Tax=Vespa mandarinia TaxID=7446 RepID=UPI00161DD5D0|nr:multiple coagulation factor deficiency protein 2 homolog [Vespa mandarinia]XP_046824854.1 multiple coagulation factor deficiency protein 2 homolog [Vespa crabro]XP_046824855.1 multiple coagulation factor deficiency protein 2 homolog [Vespa crabro]XP_047358187.1 multiple coagulation factor deficiency protein 2 homolog [Vespa velutina]XP_047358188.1 multiple coagulation factor deficiency protein 2 homolog [Vespa velutina]
MVLAFFLGLCIASAVGLRGPHHPRSSVSHHHYSPHKGVKLTQDTELLHDATHLKEDMGPIASQLDFSKMSEQEIEFHYFKVHDIDNNTKLDGLEILHAIQHTFHEHNVVDEDGRSFVDDEPQIQEDELPRIVGFIDRVLEEDDLDNDGYLGYVEFVLGRRKDHITQAKRIGRNNIKK